MEGSVQRSNGEKFLALAAPTASIPEIARVINGEKHNLRVVVLQDYSALGAEVN